MKWLKRYKILKISPKFVESLWPNILYILSMMCILKWIPQFTESIWKCTLWKIWDKYFVHIVHKIHIHIHMKMYIMNNKDNILPIIPKFEESIWKWTILMKYFVHFDSIIFAEFLWFLKEFWCFHPFNCQLSFKMTQQSYLHEKCLENTSDINRKIHRIHAHYWSWKLLYQLFPSLSLLFNPP